MTPHESIAKWKDVELTERAAAQSQFIDLCRLLDEPTPSEADPRGEWYAFEKGAMTGSPRWHAANAGSVSQGTSSMAPR